MEQENQKNKNKKEELKKKGLVKVNAKSLMVHRVTRIVAMTLIPILTTICILSILLVDLWKDKKAKLSEIDPELALAMTYDKYREGEEVVNGTNKCVEFSAFFLRDLDGDGTAEKIKGTCNEIGNQDTLYMELNVLTEGTLKNAVITIDSQNFYYNTAIVQDDQVKNSKIGENTKIIEFKNIENGTQKLLSGDVRAGDYRNENTKLDAIGNDPSKYSGVNKVTLTGTYENGGVEKQITKEIDLTVDWYGKTECVIPDKYKNKIENINKTIYIGNTKPEKFIISYTVATLEAKNELILSKSYIEGTIPEINGYKPTKVEITGPNAEYTYDAETGKFTVWRNAEENEEGTISSNAYAEVVDYKKANNYQFKVEYPGDVYDTIDRYHNFEMPIKAYYEGYNNQNEEFNNPYRSDIAEKTINILLVNEESGEIFNDITIGKYITEPEKRYVVSKEKPTKIYNKVSETEEKDYYEEKWVLQIHPEATSVKGLILKDTQNLLSGENEAQKTNQFVKRDSTKEEMGEIVKYVGIYFDVKEPTIENDGWIRVYNDETNELIKEFTREEVLKHNTLNPYYYPTGISHIRIETENQTTAVLRINNIKEINDDKLTKKYTKDQFDNIVEISGQLTTYAKNQNGNIQHVNNDTTTAKYENRKSVAMIWAEPYAVATQTSTDLSITISAPNNRNNNNVGWINGTFLVKLPPEIIDLQINNIKTNDMNVNIDSHEVYEQEGNYFIKIYTSNAVASDYRIIIEAKITANPIISTKTSIIELFAVNENGNDYYYNGQDTYDVNNNGNIAEIVANKRCEVRLVSPGSLVTSSEISEYNTEGTVSIAPKIAEIDKERREAKVTLKFMNNYGGTISDVVVMGKIPFVGNTYILNGRDLGSQFTATMKNTGLEIPEELLPYAKTYYTENENPTEDIKDSTNGWATKESVTNWNNIKSYIIVLENFEMPKNNLYSISYKLNIPEGLNYNDVSYSTHTVYFSLDTEEGKYKTNVESNKLGIMIAKQYNLELTKYQINIDKLVKGAIYSATDEETKESKVAVTGEDGKLLIKGLYAEKTYKIEEIRTPSEYSLNEEAVIIKTATDAEDNLTVQIESGKARNINVEKEEGKDWKVTLEVEDEPKARVEVTKTDKATGTVLSGVHFRITGRDKAGITLTTNGEGKASSTGLYLGAEYTLEETKANGYFLNQPIKFTINRDTTATVSETGNTSETSETDVGARGIVPVEEQYSYTITEGTVKNSELIYDNGIPILKLEIEDEPRPTYTLEIVKIEKDQPQTSIVGAKFEINGPGMDSPRSFTTDESGTIQIDKLYIGTDETEAVEYTLTETEAPTGYIKIEPITFKAYNEGDNLVYKTIKGQVKASSIEGNTVSIEIEDEPVFKLVKKDGTTAETLPNVKFALYSIDIETNEESFAVNTKGEVIGDLETINGKEYRVITTNENGQITADLGDGLYKVVELETLKQYELPEDIEERTYYFGIGNVRAGGIEALDKWHTTIEGDKNVRINDIIQTSDKGYLVNGFFESSTLTLNKKDGTKIQLTNNGTANSFIIKYNENREILWADSIGGNGYENCYDKMIETTYGDYILAGDTTYGVEDVTLSDGTVLKSHGSNDVIIVKYNKDGIIQWSDRIGGTGGDLLRSISSTQDGGFILSTHINGTTMISQKTDQEINIGTHYGDLLLKYDKDGALEKNIVLLTNNTRSIIETEDNGYLTSGEINSTTTLPNGETITNKSVDTMITKYDLKGNLIWYDVIGGDNADTTKTTIKLKDGGYIEVGSFRCDVITLSNGDKLYSGGNEIQSFIVKYNEDGKIEWSNQSNAGDLVTSAIPTKDGGFILAATTRLEKYDKNGQLEMTINSEEFGVKSSDQSAGISCNNLIEIDDNKYIIAGIYGPTTELPSGATITSDSSYNKAIIAQYDITITPEVENLGDVNTIPEQIQYVGDYGYYIGGSGYENVTNVSVTKDGGFVAVQPVMSKTTTITLKDGTKRELTNAGSRYNNVIVRYDNTGSATWATIIGGTGHEDIMYDIQATSDYGFIVSGMFMSTNDMYLDIEGVQTKIENSGGRDGIIIKYDQEGNIEWYDTIGGSDAQYFSDVVETNDGYIAIGFTKGITKLKGQKDLKTDGIDVLIIKYDKSGNIVDYKVVCGQGDDQTEVYPKVIQKTSDDGFIFGMKYKGTLLFNDEKTISKGSQTTDYSKGIVIKCNSNLELEWSNVIQGSSYISAVSQTTDGGYVAACNYDKNIVLSNKDLIVYEEKTGNEKGKPNGILIKYDSKGNIEWHRETETNLNGVKGLSSGEIIAVGNDKNAIVVYDINGNKKWNLNASYSITSINEASEELGGGILVGGVTGANISNMSMKNTRPGGNDGFVIKLHREQVSPEIQGKLELTVPNSKKEYKIQTNVKVLNGAKGGSISGQTDFVYETVQYGNTNTKEIVMTPEANYEVISITINGKEIVGEGLASAREDGTYIIAPSAFTNITENKAVEVTYGLSSNKVTIEKVDAEDRTKKLEGAKLRLERVTSEDDTEDYEIELTTNANGQAVASIPYGTYKVTEIEAPEGYVINETIQDIEFTEGGTHTFTIEDFKKPSVSVHHYLKDREGNETTTEVSETEIIYGDRGEKYTTLPKLDLEGYELEKDAEGEYILPENVSGEFVEGNTVVNYYYKEKETTLTVHYYIEGTEIKVPLEGGGTAEDIERKGYAEESYETVALESAHEKYELIETPENAVGTYGKGNIIVTYYYRLKTYDITTKVKPKEETDSLGEIVRVKGGTITGEDETPYEEVEHGENSKKPITITPDENYRIKTVTINGTVIYSETGTATTSETTDTYVGAGLASAREDGTLTLDTIENITEDKIITVEFEKKMGTVTVHHYIQGTDNKVPGRVAETVIEDEIKTGYIGDIYATKEKTSEEISEAYVYVSSSGETSGTYTVEEKEVTYYYVTRAASIIVHHYIYDREADTEANKYTKTKLIEDVVTEGMVGQDYEAVPSSEIPANYVCIDAEPENHAGKMTEGVIEISYYYELINPTLENKIEITAETGKYIMPDGTINSVGARGTVPGRRNPSTNHRTRSSNIQHKIYSNNPKLQRKSKIRTSKHFARHNRHRQIKHSRRTL